MSSARSAVFRVELTDRAGRDLAAIHDDINAESSAAAAAWFNGLEATILRLETAPERGMRAREERGLRQLLYGRKPHFYRILYCVHRSTRRVIVLHIRHGARDEFAAGNVEG